MMEDEGRREVDEEGVGRVEGESGGRRRGTPSRSQVTPSWSSQPQRQHQSSPLASRSYQSRVGASQGVVATLVQPPTDAVALGAATQYARRSEGVGTLEDGDRWRSRRAGSDEEVKEEEKDEDDEEMAMLIGDSERQRLIGSNRDENSSTSQQGQGQQSTIPSAGKPCSGGVSTRVQRLVLVGLGLSLLLYQFLSDHVYIWMMTTEITSMLMPGSVRYCTDPALWVPFHSEPKQRNVALVSVVDKRPEEQQGSTPSFKRLSSKLTTEALRQHGAYAEFWGYNHVLWEATANANILGRRPPAWGKLLAIQQALETHDYVLYLDLDLAIMQPMLHLDGFIAQLERSGRDLLVSQDKNGVNTGVMLFRKSEWSMWFLRELWRLSDELSHCDCIFYYEQRAFHHALQTEQWRAGYKWWTHHIPIIGWFPNSLRGHPPGPTLDDLPLYGPNNTLVSAEEVWSHVELSPQCALNAVDHYSDAEFIVHFAGHKGRRKERLMQHFGALAAQRLETVASRLRFLGPSAMPVVHQTWKTHELEPRKKAWHASWARNGFTVQLHNDTECLDDVTRLAEQTGHPSLVTVYQGLTPVQRADFWRYAIAYLEGGIYSDIDIAATPETANFFLSLDQAQTDLVGIIENDPYDNSIGRFHWKVGMSPMYSRIPQLRQSFFYAKQGHPHLLELLLQIEKKAETWAKSGHRDIGNPSLSPEKLRAMEASGALTLEMTGPGVWTDVMLTPLQAEDTGRRRKRKAGKRGDTRLHRLGDGVKNIILPTLEGYSLIRYGSMGSWKTADHKADGSMWRNMVLFYSTPLLLALLWRSWTKYQRAKRSKIA